MEKVAKLEHRTSERRKWLGGAEDNASLNAARSQNCSYYLKDLRAGKMNSTIEISKAGKGKKKQE